ncbi:penicillin-binding protein [Occultella glacieicola]|uniref:Penicillin-binding protein n=1 Tax=Occultella glacieicola TaxID=2518684 RepID=A0ABY2E9I0_9MICO|nr:penicillin-binding protein [Occultella glacieicola]
MPPAGGGAAARNGSSAQWKKTASARPSRTATTTTSAAAPSGRSASKGARAKKGYKGRPYQEPRRFWNYPRPNKGPIHRWLPSWRFVLGTFVAFLLLGVGLFVYAYQTIGVPEPDDVAMAEGSTVYFADGTTEMGTFAEVNREIIATEELPEYVGQAVVASEDRRFYSNAGVDPIGILRALWNNLQGNPTQGGSTLTQQYVERYYTGQTSSYADKFREAILAIKIDREQPKDEILGNYMNTIYFGRGAYGIERAAQEYFGHSAAELTLSESALIAGIIPSPSNWDPAVSPEQAERRWNRTLDYMVESGFITAAERNAQEFPATIEPTRSDTYAGPTGYLLEMVRAELLAAGLTADQIDGGGLDIVSTIDPELQAAAITASQNMPEDTPAGVRVALTSIDNETGGIVALYGGADYLTVQRNAATQDVAQGGSTFKVFGLIAALENGVTLEDRYASYSPMDVDGYEVRNFDRVNRGNIDLVEATENSVNTVYVQMNSEVGPEHLVDVAHRLGLPEETAIEAVPSNVLGPAAPHPADMAEAYSTIASGGVHRDRYIVASATNGDGQVLYMGGSEEERVVEADVIADATYAMQQVVESGTGETASEIGRPAAGKTGSSNDYRSAWFVGFVPQITTSVAMYQVGENGEEVSMVDGFGGVSPISGGSFPTDIWTEYMTTAVADLPVEDFPDRTEPEAPTWEPTEEPTTEEPTEEPTTPEPTEEPTTPEPTEEPTQEPTEEPTEEPTDEPTGTPTDEPTDPPTEEPTNGTGVPGWDDLFAPPGRNDP